MLVIRLARGGSKHRPFYHIRATDKRNPRDGRYNEQLGYFNPIARGGEKRLVINKERIDQLLEHGVQISDRVKQLLHDYEMGEEAFTERREASRKKIARRKAAKKAASEQPGEDVQPEEAAKEEASE